MKTLSKIMFAAMAAASLAALSANADELAITQVPSGHGQYTFLYCQGSDPTVALFVGGGEGVGWTSDQPSLQIVMQDNGHGRTRVVYRNIQ